MRRKMGKKTDGKKQRETRMNEKKREGKRRKRRGEGSCPIRPDVWNEVRVHNI